MLSKIANERYSYASYLFKQIFNSKEKEHL